MKEDILKKIEELQDRRYYQIGDVYAILVELKTFVRSYEDINSNTNE